MMNKLFSFITAKIKSGRRNRRYRTISKGVSELRGSSKSNIKILYGPCFSVYEPSRVHDFILSQALSLRGADIIPCSMGKLQFGETSYIGGEWAGSLMDKDISAEKSQRNYETVAIADKELWETWSGMNPIALDKFISSERIGELKALALTYSFEAYNEWRFMDLPVGKWAVDTIRNNSLVSDETLIPFFQKKIYDYLHHVIVMVEALNGILDVVNPDIVICNDTYYYPWAILEKLAEMRDIPSYNCYPNIRKNAVCYAKGEPAMKLNISRKWQSFKTTALSPTDSAMLDDFFSNRQTGKYAPGLNTSDPAKNAVNLEEFDYSRIDPDKPTALLTPNVCWDLAALNKDVQFKSMFNWIDKVIDFFAAHPEWQLIIKPHPAEENMHIPNTRQTVVKHLVDSKKKIPANVILLGAKTEISVYDLFPTIQVGLVYTTTVGLEMACLGIPVVTSGRSHYHSMGFTFDPVSEEEYEETLCMLLTNKGVFKEEKEWSELARKFMFLYQFVYPIDLQLFEYDLVNADITFSDVTALLPGKSNGLDFVCSKILNKEAIF